ncbi:hypothetical protein NHQ30_005005 [Ciborinia camelliae]|nr:hypothetical protein NHQ30_005005 [Ciborinia camelliae]
MLTALVLTNPTQNELLADTVPDLLSTAQSMDGNILAEYTNTHRGTSPPPGTNPIGFERNLAHQLDQYISNVSISSRKASTGRYFGMTAGDSTSSHIIQQKSKSVGPSASFEDQRSSDLISRDRNDFIVQEPVSHLLTSHDETASADTYQGNMNIFINAYFINSKAAALIGNAGVLPEHRPRMQQNINMQSTNISNEHQGLAKFHRETQDQHSQGLGRAMQYTLSDQKTSNQVSNGSKSPLGSFQSSDDSTKSQSHPTNSNRASRDFQGLDDTALELIQRGIQPTNQLLREKGLMAPISAQAMSVSKYVGDHDGRPRHDRNGGELGLPPHLNCAVWIRGIPKQIHKDSLYQELFKAVSIGPIVGAYINEAGDSFSHHAAKVVFKHPEHANRLCYKANTSGIQIYGQNLHVEPNRFGYREYPHDLHYQSRVVVVEVFNDPSMGLEYWLRFVKSLCVVGIEKTRHRSCSTPNRMVMEFRFARIFGQSQILLHGIKNSSKFNGKVFARYVPDIVCDLHHN